MKNVLMLFTFFSIAMGISAQEGLKVGIQGGLPIDDFNDEVSLVVGVDVGYMWALGEVVDLGIAAGFLNGFAESFHSDVVLTDLPNVQFVPLAASVRVWPSNSFSFGVDVGNAFGINEGNDGGLYYRPIIGYLFGPQTEINLSYTAVDLDNRKWTTVNLGFLFTFELNSRR